MIDEGRLLRAADKSRIDARSAAMGVSPRQMMDAAGSSLADAACAHAPDARRILIVCGPGDNGGDGFVAARMLHDRGKDVTVLALPAMRSRSDAAAAAYDGWASVSDVTSATPAVTRRTAAAADLVVDAMFGTGLSRPVAGDVAAVVDAVTSSGTRILSADLPSGLMADRAEPSGPHVRAWRTVQFGGACLASVLSPSRFAFGEWTIADVGHPSAAFGPEADDLRWTTDDAVRAGLPRVSPGAHKGQSGHVVVVGGSLPYPGAVALTCNAAHRAGAGLVTLASTVDVPAAWPETIRLPVDSTVDRPFHHAASSPLLRHADAWVMGPGLHEADVHDLRSVVQRTATPIVIDAGALLPGLRESVARHGRCWLTPHAGEAARLLEWSQREVDEDPIAAAQRLAIDWNAGIVLKKAGAVVVDPGGRVRVVVGGHPGMASGGTGDALAGIVGTFLARPTADPLTRVAAACRLHARAGESAAARYGLGLRASDLVEVIPKARKAFGDAW